MVQTTARAKRSKKGLLTPDNCVLASAVPLVVVGSLALAQQDRYTLKIPDGLAWSEFRGYEDWRDVAVVRPKPA